jgi:hypothetical protein
MENSPMSSSPSPELRLTVEIQTLVNGALESGNPLLLAVVGQQGQPMLSFRGSAQVYSDSQIGLWVRNTQGGTLEAIKHNPHVALMYRSPVTPMLQFQGIARITTDAAERARIFDLSPKRERDADPERQGAAILIDLVKVEGVLAIVDGKPQVVRLSRQKS